MQYKIGTVAVTNGSNVVIGSGTSFLANVRVGDYFKASGVNTIYQISQVVSDTEIRIVSVYGGISQGVTQYQIGRDRTPILGLAEINAGDEDWTYWLTQEVIRKLDLLVGGGNTGGGGGPAVFTDAGGTGRLCTFRMTWVGPGIDDWQVEVVGTEPIAGGEPTVFTDAGGTGRLCTFRMTWVGPGDDDWQVEVVGVP